MATRNIPSREMNVGDRHLAIYEAARAVQMNGGFTYEGLSKSSRELMDAGIDLNAPAKLGDKKFTSKIEKFLEIGQKPVASFAFKDKAISLSAPEDSLIGINTFEISNQLIQDASPENAMEDSPLNIMMPFRTIDSVQFQQDIMSSNWGWADGDNGVNGAVNAVSLLETQTNSYKGYTISEISFLEGEALIKLREVGSSDTERRGAIQKLNYGMLNLLQRASTGLELNRIESIVKGSWTYKEGSLTPQNLVISSQLPASNITTLTQSLGTYTKSTNTFVRNSAMTVNALVQLGESVTAIKNMGLAIDKIIVDNITYGAIFNSPAVQSQTQYISMNSDNDVMDIRRNLFKITTIPALQGIAIEVDDRAVKINSNKTTKINTRPLWWGKEVTSSSFRALIVMRPQGNTRIADFGFFPNQYARTTQIGGGSRSMGGYGGGIVMVNQDLSTFDITNQKIQIFAASASAPIVYLPHLIHPFDFNVTVND